MKPTLTILTLLLSGSVWASQNETQDPNLLTPVTGAVGADTSGFDNNSQPVVERLNQSGEEILYLLDLGASSSQAASAAIETPSARPSHKSKSKSAAGKLAHPNAHLASGNFPKHCRLLPDPSACASSQFQSIVEDGKTGGSH